MTSSCGERLARGGNKWRDAGANYVRHKWSHQRVRGRSETLHLYVLSSVMSPCATRPRKCTWMRACVTIIYGAWAPADGWRRVAPSQSSTWLPCCVPHKRWAVNALCVSEVVHMYEVGVAALSGLPMSGIVCFFVLFFYQIMQRMAVPQGAGHGKNVRRRVSDVWTPIRAISWDHLTPTPDKAGMELVCM